MALVLQILSILIGIEIYALLARVILEYVRVFARAWQPRGFMLVVAELVYSVTDPLVRAARRLIPPLRLGAVAIDVSVLALFFLLQVAQWLLAKVAASL